MVVSKYYYFFSEEDSVTLDYLKQIHDRHEEWLIEKTVNIPDRY